MGNHADIHVRSSERIPREVRPFNRQFPQNVPWRSDSHAKSGWMFEYLPFCYGNNTTLQSRGRNRADAQMGVAARDSYQWQVI
jgi:hypothetical protein